MCLLSFQGQVFCSAQSLTLISPQQRPKKTVEQGGALDNAQNSLSDQPPLSSQHLSALTSYALGGWLQPGVAFG